MTSISGALLKKIKDLLTQSPLEVGEFRRIEGMGSHFMSLQSTREGRQHFFSATVDGKEIFFFKE